MGNVIKPITQYIETQIASLTVGTNLFAGEGDDTNRPDICVFILESVPGIENYYVPTLSVKPIQVIVRDTAYQSARDTAWEIYDLFYGKYNTNVSLPAVTTGEDSYVAISTTGSEPFSLGRDAESRYTFSVNLTLYLELQ